ncbi:fimbrial protein [Franconibacter pulveris 601]|uniref:fimbrial protein n=1 Tax=Franconibacter pulveris TaxID=435910 RepID=UPI0008FEE02B|nr:fimbrial protein [Franconibacter pulveris]
MNKILFCILALVTSNTYADVVWLNFTGTIKIATCKVLNSSPQSVDLGTVFSNHFSGPGDATPAVPFSISLECNTSNPGSIKVLFTGQADGVDQTLLALDDVEGVAKGVAIRINDENGQKVNINTETVQHTLVGNSTNVLNFSAQVQATKNSAEISAGKIIASVQFDINYQ